MNGRVKKMAIIFVLVTAAIFALAMPVIEGDPDAIASRVQSASSNLQAKENPWSLDSSSSSIPSGPQEVPQGAQSQLPPSSGRAGSMSGRSANMAQSQTASNFAKDSKVTLQRQGDGHFYADTQANGTKLRMLVDTGASVVALTGRDAKKMGISWDNSRLAQVAQGASGPVIGTHTVISELTLGGISAKNVSAIVIPEGLPISLLGQNFLSTIGDVQISGDRMVLGS